jgi:hypothetical protein
MVVHRQHAPELVALGKQRGRLIRQPHIDAHQHPLHGGYDAIHQVRNALRETGGDVDRVGRVSDQLAQQGGIAHAIRFVEHGNRRLLVCLQLDQRGFHRIALQFPVRAGDVDDMNQKVRLAHFLKGGVEGFQQHRGQVLHEAYGVGQQHRPAIRQHDSARGGIQRGEHAVVHIGLRARQHIQQGGLACVGVADDGTAGEGQFAPRAALVDALAAEFFDFVAQVRDALADASLVDLQFRLARTARADAAAQTRQGDPFARQARHQVQQLREFDLQRALARARPLREDVQNQLRAVNHARLGNLLQVALLHRVEFHIEQDDIRLVFAGELEQHFGFALADIGGDIGELAFLARLCDDSDTCGVR